jgi:hypothetical protein
LRSSVGFPDVASERAARRQDITPGAKTLK